MWVWSGFVEIVERGAVYGGHLQLALAHMKSAVRDGPIGDCKAVNVV